MNTPIGKSGAHGDSGETFGELKSRPLSRAVTRPTN